ncbi:MULTISPECIES: LolA family protein [Cyclobacterium]|uniref:Outer membrane lipoprotein carrier protein LolA n=1 Tax=Cyclobacterium plantarum TaxID=2716263 RepID=A0ABX0HEZ7_9BACT|nr:MULTISPECIES: outer membrane lipoprotein carrier protein LolA [Cyclobacterium]MBD3628327.1 outer membrane lipoprotein carrier protein LolA [Cyclobacterium sp.]NHE59117.1 outer membrane lipoprotein carrier protein LolA [Cyclobacterium plantarum]
MKGKKTIIASLIFLCFFQVSFGQNDPKAVEILDKVSDNYQKLNGFSAIFEYTYSTEDEGLIQTNTGEVTVKGEKYRLTLNDQEIFNNGNTVWTLIKSSKYKEVTINDVEEDTEELTPSNIYSIYKKGYEAKLEGSSVMNGVPVHEIMLTAEKPNAQFEKIKLYVDKSRFDLLAWEIQDDVGGTFKYTFKDLDSNINIMDDYFVFNTSENQDVEIIDLR